MRPRFLPRGQVTTEEPPVEPREFDDYDREVIEGFAQSVLNTGIFIVGMVLVLAWVAA